MSVSPAPSIVYVYGVVPSCCKAGPEDLPDVPEKTGSPSLRVLPCGEIAALVGDLTLPDGSSFEEILQDNRQAEQMILDHHRVLAWLVARYTVLPLRFGTVFADDRRVMAALEQHSDALIGALDRIDGALEWGLKVFCERRSLGKRLARDNSAMRDLGREIAGAGEGTAFFLRRRKERHSQAAVEDAVERCLDHTAARLTAVARAASVVRIQPPEVHGRASAMVLNRAFLVDRHAEGGFFDRVDDLRAMYEPFGFAYETTGPWPPYSFAECGLKGDDHAH